MVRFLNISYARAVSFIATCFFVGCFLENLDMFGHDLPNMPKLIQSTMECPKLCKQDPKCTMWTTFEGACYLKHKHTGKLKPGPNYTVSGSRTCNSTSKYNKWAFKMIFSYAIHYIYLHYFSHVRDGSNTL